MRKNVKDVKTQKNQKLKKWIGAAIAVAVLGSGVAIYTAFSNSSVASASNNVSTITLSKTDISNTISISGQVDSSNTVNVYSSLTNYPVKKVLVEVGSQVKKGDILANIDTTALQYDITQAENNLANAQKSLDTEKQNNQNNIVNSQNSLNSDIVSRDRQQLAYEKSLADLKEIEEAKTFDSYTYDNAIIAAKAILDKAKSDLTQAQNKLQTQTNAFDSYTYQNAITAAQNDINRTKADLQKEIDDKNAAITSFDSSSYNYAINSAQVEVNRKTQDYNDALIANGNALVVAEKRALEDAQYLLNLAYNDLSVAQSNFTSSTQSTQTAADARVTAAQNSVTDAQNAYDYAVKDLERARQLAIEDAEKNVTSATLVLSDAERDYNNSVSDLKRAKDKSVQDINSQLLSAKRNVADAANSLQAAKLNVTNSQNRLKQAKSCILTSSITNQQIELDQLVDQFAKSDITALASGTITKVNAIVGVNPNDILFTIEDENLLYVSAKVKEYDLKNLSIGQSVFVATDATDKQIFDGDIIYISPKAVSEAGSTSVEFEIWVAIKKPSDNIKIGMNSFLEIVIDSKKNVYVVPLAAIITNENGNFVRTQSGNETIDIPVNIGIKTSTSTEISGEGITDGLIILSDPS